MSRQLLKHFITTGMVLSGIFIIASLTLQLVAFNNNWFIYKFEKFDISNQTGIESDDLKRISRRLID